MHFKAQIKSTNPKPSPPKEQFRGSNLALVIPIAPSPPTLSPTLPPCAPSTLFPHLPYPYLAYPPFYPVHPFTLCLHIYPLPCPAAPSQSISQSDSQSDSQSASQSVSQAVIQSISQSVSQSVSHSVSQSISSVSQSVSLSFCQSASQSASRPVGQFSQSVSQCMEPCSQAGCPMESSRPSGAQGLRTTGRDSWRFHNGGEAPSITHFKLMPIYPTPWPQRACWTP